MLTKVGLRKSPAVMGALAFKSFDTRFDDILTDLKYSQEILKFEIELLHLWRPGAAALPRSDLRRLRYRQFAGV